MSMIVTVSLYRSQSNVKAILFISTSLNIFSKMSAEEIAAAFINHYFTTLDTNPQALVGLYVCNQ